MGSSTLRTRRRLSIALSLAGMAVSCATPRTPEESAIDRDFEVVYSPDFVERVGDAPAVAVFDGAIHKASSTVDACDIVARQNPEPLHAYIIERSRLDPSSKLEIKLPPGFSESSTASHVGTDVIAALADRVSIDPIHGLTTLTRNGKTIDVPFDAKRRPAITITMSPASDPARTSEVTVVLVPNCGRGVLLSTSDASRFSFRRSESNESTIAGEPIPTMILESAFVRVGFPPLDSQTIVLAWRIRTRSN